MTYVIAARDSSHGPRPRGGGSLEPCIAVTARSRREDCGGGTAPPGPRASTRYGESPSRWPGAELFALLGTNGAGTTSTVELLEGLAAPTGGEVRVPGHDPYRDLAADGASIADIARRAALSRGTVRNYLASAVMKPSAENGHAAAQMARERGWL
nr:ATP-binding cassette domain-containing protein [Streptomyces sp. NA02950]